MHAINSMGSLSGVLNEMLCRSFIHLAKTDKITQINNI